MIPIVFERTPNPDALRVLPGRVIWHGPPREFTEAGDNAIAAALLAIPGIARILLGRDFLTVVRDTSGASWQTLRPEIALVLLEAEEAPVGPRASAVDTSPSEIEQQIEEVLNRWVRPLLASHGGEAVMVRFDPAYGTLWVRMEGACGGCPSGVVTLKRGIEETVRRWVPEVTRVVSTGTAAVAEADPKARFRKWIAAKWGLRQD